MVPANLPAYINWRRSIFDPKADCDPTFFAGDYRDLCKAAGAMIEPNGLYGRLHQLFRFNDVSGSHLLRVFGKPSVPAYHLHIEEWVAQKAQSGGVSTVIPTLTDTSRYLVPFDFQILPFVESETLAKQDEEGIKTGLSQVAFQLGLLHGIKLKGYGPLDPRPLFEPIPSEPSGLFDTWWDYITLRLEDHVDICRAIGAITSEESTRIFQLFAGSDPFSFTPVLLHGDLSNVNILYEKGASSIQWPYTLIDWENAISGDPVFDIAQWSAFHMPDRFEFIINAYYKHIDKPLDFDQRFWLYYLRVVLARTVHRHRFGVLDNPKFPPASKRIQIALNYLS